MRVGLLSAVIHVVLTPEQQLDTISGTGLSENTVNMGFYGINTDVQLLCDFFILRAFGNQFHNRQLTFRQGGIRCYQWRRNGVF